jgi:MFS family permease
VLWIVVEWHGTEPLIDLRLMSTRGVAGPNLVAILIGIASYGSFAFLPQFVQTPVENGYGFGSTVGESGYLMLPSALMSFSVGLMTARLVRRWGARLIIAAGCAITSTGLAIAAFAHDRVWQILFSNTVTGLGGGLVFACLANAVVAAVPQESTGMATGMNANLRTIGGSIGSAMLAGLLTADVQTSGYSTEAGYTIGFALLAATALLAAVASFLIPRDSPVDQ